MAKEKETKKNVHEVVIKIEGDEWTKALDKVFAKKQKTAKVDGFRTGKVPRDIYEKNFGKESLYFDAADELVQVAYIKAMEESKLIPAVQPGVDLRSINENGVEFVFNIITKPEVKVKKYKIYYRITGDLVYIVRIFHSLQTPVLPDINSLML